MILFGDHLTGVAAYWQYQVMSYDSITPISILSDNYAWIVQTAGSRAVVIDPGEAGPVTAWLAERNLELEAILLTHHHGDHTGGVRQLASSSHIRVFGPATESISGVNQPVKDDDVVKVDELRLKVWEVPGHTRGHVAYVGDGLVFTGDTLFAGGCGRIFEGTPEQMLTSLTRLAILPADTRVYCAHEYTMSNLAFATVVEPDSTQLAKRRQAIRKLLDQGLPSVPSTVVEELATNPFLRSHEPAVVAAVSRHCGGQLSPGVEVFAETRRWKDSWRG
jgi:hydroxyacylglutathione hydrolase